MARSASVLTMLLLCWPTLAAAGPFAGSFSGDGVQLSLRENGATAEGEAVIEGNRHPVKAQIQGARITGQYLYEGEWVPFSGTIDGSTLTIVSEGTTYRLARQGGVLAAVSPPNAAAQAASTNTPGALRNDGWGIRLKAPAGWTAQSHQGGFAFTSSAHKGTILVFPHEATTTQELRDGAAAGLEEGGGKLALDGAPASFGKSGIAASFKGTVDGKPAAGHAVGLLNPHGSGAVVLAVAEAKELGEAQKKAVEALAKSVEFYKPPVPEAVTGWDKELANSQLDYISYYRSSGFGGGGSTSQNIRITLCDDRSFWFRGNSQTSIDVGQASGYASNKEGAGGTWSVVMSGPTPMLQLRFASGEVSSYRVAYENKKLFLNGDRYYWSRANCGR